MKANWNSFSLQKRLGLVRILYFSFFLFIVNFDYLIHFSEVPFKIECSNNMGIWYFFDLSPEQMQFGKWICITATIFAAVGLFSRMAYLIVFASFFVLNMYALKFCYWNHLYMPFHISLFLWFLLDSQSGFRLENLFLKKKDSALDSINSDIQFLVMCQRVFFAIIFFAGGYSKLVYGGWDWIFSSSLRNMINVQNFANFNTIKSPYFIQLNHWFVENPTLCKFLAFDAVFIELLAPLILFSKRAARFIIVHLLLLQIGIVVLMYIDFTSWFALYLFWLPLLNRERTFELPQSLKQAAFRVAGKLQRASVK